MIKNELTQEQLKNMLEYNPETGVFAWKDRDNCKVRQYKGDIAGHIMKDGYRMVRIFRHGYLAHRLAYLYMVGKFPPDEIDHINGERDDNRWQNLRPVNRRQNFQNRKCHREGNLPGTSYCPYFNKQKPWMAQIQVNKKKIHLGQFSTKELAHAAYKNACANIAIGH